MKLRSLLFALMLPVAMHAQGVRYDSNIFTAAGNVPTGAQAPMYTLPYSKIIVCSSPATPATGSPCTNTVPIFSDQGLIQPITQPITSDSQGRYGFWVTPGTYTYSVVSPSGAFLGTLPITFFGSSPAGSAGQIQINNGGSFGAISQNTFAQTAPSGNQTITQPLNSALGINAITIGSAPITNVLPININSVPAQEYVSTTRPPLANWFQSFHNCQSQVVNIMLYGDSRVRVDDIIAQNGSFGLPHGYRWADRLAQYLGNVCPSHGTGLVTVIAGTDGSNAIDANYWSSTSTISSNPAKLTGPYQQGPSTSSAGVAAVNTGTVLNFNPGIAFDGLNIYCESATLEGSWAISIDGSSSGSCGTGTGSNTATLVQVSGLSLANHVVTLTCTIAACGIYGAEATVGSVGVSVHNVSVGSAAAEWFGLNPATQMDYTDLIPGGHHLDIIQFIANEPGVGYSPTSFQNALTAIITHERSLSSVPSIVLISPMQDGIAGQTPYYPIIPTVALAETTAYVDFRDREGLAQVMSLYGPDTFHENIAGNAEEYSMVHTTIIDTSIPQVSTLQSCPGGLAVTGLSPQGKIVCGVVQPCGTGFAHGATLTLSHATGGMDLLNFPIELSFNGATANSITLAGLAGTGSGGGVTDLGGKDIVFCLSNGQLLNFELNSGTYVSSTGAGIWYVQIPDVASSGIATSIQVMWGNSSAANAQNLPGTWSNGYVAVYHTSPGNFLLDSTGNNATLALAPDTSGVTSPLGSALSFTNTQYAIATSPSSIPIGNAARTIEAWQQFPSMPSAETVMFGYGGNFLTGFTLEYSPRSSSVGPGYDEWPHDTGFILSAADTNWHYFATTLTSGGNSGNVLSYKDGSVGATCGSVSGANCSQAIATNSGIIQMNGVPGTSSNGAQGTENLTELRISNVARSAGWIATQYSNQSNPGAFITVSNIH